MVCIILHYLAKNGIFYDTYLTDTQLRDALFGVPKKYFFRTPNNSPEHLHLYALFSITSHRHKNENATKSVFCSVLRVFSYLTGGESGIRTRGTSPYTSFPSLRLKPLGHLSAQFASPNFLFNCLRPCPVL